LPFEISSTVKLRLRDVTILVVTDEPAMLCVLDNERCIDSVIVTLPIQPC